MESETHVWEGIEDPDNPGYARPVKPSKISITMGHENIIKLLKYQDKRGISWEQVEAMLKGWIVERLDAESK